MTENFDDRTFPGCCENKRRVTSLTPGVGVDRRLPAPPLAGVPVRSLSRTETVGRWKVITLYRVFLGLRTEEYFAVFSTGQLLPYTGGKGYLGHCLQGVASVEAPVTSENIINKDDIHVSKPSHLNLPQIFEEHK